MNQKSGMSPKKKILLVSLAFLSFLLSFFRIARFGCIDKAFLFECCVDFYCDYANGIYNEIIKGGIAADSLIGIGRVFSTMYAPFAVGPFLVALLNILVGDIGKSTILLSVLPTVLSFYLLYTFQKGENSETQFFSLAIFASHYLVVFAFANRGSEALTMCISLLFFLSLKKSLDRRLYFIPTLFLGVVGVLTRINFAPFLVLAPMLLFTRTNGDRRLSNCMLGVLVIVIPIMAYFLFIHVFSLYQNMAVWKTYLYGADNEKYKTPLHIVLFLAIGFQLFPILIVIGMKETASERLVYAIPPILLIVILALFGLPFTNRYIAPFIPSLVIASTNGISRVLKMCGGRELLTALISLNYVVFYIVTIFNIAA
ncbi:MAG: hypothetical protein QXP42_01590 [Candidatus Micrarchaeia archaeon]